MGREPDDIRAERLAILLRKLDGHLDRQATRRRQEIVKRGSSVRQWRRVPPRQTAIPDMRLAVTSSLPLYFELCPEAIRFLATADRVAEILPVAEDLDWSVAVIGLCKAFEVEVIRRLLEPLRDQLRGLDLDSDIAEPRTRELALYVAGKTSRPPALGTVVHSLALAGADTPAATLSPLLTAIRDAAVEAKSEWLIGNSGFVSEVRQLTRRYRNRAVHVDLLVRSDFEACREMLFGTEGVFPRFQLPAIKFASALIVR